MNKVKFVLGIFLFASLTFSIVSCGSDDPEDKWISELSESTIGGTWAGDMGRQIKAYSKDYNIDDTIKAWTSYVIFKRIGHYAQRGKGQQIDIFLDGPFLEIYRTFTWSRETKDGVDVLVITYDNDTIYNQNELILYQIGQNGKETSGYLKDYRGSDIPELDKESIVLSYDTSIDWKERTNYYNNSPYPYKKRDNWEENYKKF